MSKAKDSIETLSIDDNFANGTIAQTLVCEIAHIVPLYSGPHLRLLHDATSDAAGSWVGTDPDIKLLERRYVKQTKKVIRADMKWKLFSKFKRQFFYRYGQVKRLKRYLFTTYVHTSTI